MIKPASGKVLLIHPGVQHAPILAGQLNKLKLLQSYITGAILSKSCIFTKILLRIPILNLIIAPRAYDMGPHISLHNFFLTELYFILLNRFPFLSKKGSDVWLDRNLSVQRRINDAYFREANCIIGFDTASSIIVKKAISFNKQFILDVTTAHPLHKLEIMQKRSHADISEGGFDIDKNELPANYFKEEYLLSSKIVTASSFVKKGLVNQGVPENKIAVIPYGVDGTLFQCKNFADQNRPIKILYVGNITEFKGIRTLISAIMHFKKNEVMLTLVGWGSDDFKQRNQDLNYDSCQFFGKIAKQKLPEIYRSHDLFIFPSFIDGFGLVILEAMSSGLPVIASKNSAGPDLITAYKEGFLFEPFSIDELIRHISFFLENPSAIQTMGLLARLRAESYTWDSYGERWAELINSNNNQGC